jgi:hypothetical protein
MELGEKLGDENGFTQILPGEANENYLREYKNNFTGQINF